MKQKVFTLATIILTILATSCSNGLDYMIEEYNSRFGIHDDSIFAPGDSNYNPQDMILPEYHVERGHTLNIPAPLVQGATYKWQIFKEGKEVTDFIKMENGMTTSTFHLLEEDLPIGTYILKLTVTIGEKALMDEALITVHQEREDIPMESPEEKPAGETQGE